MFLLRTELLKELFIFLQGQHKCPLIEFGHFPTLNAPLLIKKNRKKKVLTNNSTGYRPQRTPPSKSTS